MLVIPSDAIWADKSLQPPEVISRYLSSASVEDGEAPAAYRNTYDRAELEPDSDDVDAWKTMIRSDELRREIAQLPVDSRRLFSSALRTLRPLDDDAKNLRRAAGEGGTEETM